ncbi:MAG: type II secretion system minor pseudopilin GspH [Plesiomonas sp.]|uniref:type II secretion system minor pseudopilin GspH n=1 Tax=Plesiomonas sp. TaxID=2486279 RepID=UPI003F31D0C7
MIRRGFTLLEMMLVIFLIGLAGSGVMMMLPDNKQDQAKEEAQRFLALAQLMQEEAILGGRLYGIRIDKTRYQLMQREQGEWQPLRDQKFTTAVTLPQGLTLDLMLGQYRWQNAQESDLELSRMRLNLHDENTTLNDEQNKNKQPPPQIWLDAGGDSLPFTLSFKTTERMANHNAPWAIKGEENGDLQLVAPSTQDSQ